jgi:tetratricopeptide (TPR) repeat protein
MRGLAAFCVAALAVASAVFSQSQSKRRITGEDVGYLEAQSCALCHRAIYESYRRTGMGRSYYRPAPTNTVEDYTRHNTYYHEASGQYFTMTQRYGRYYQRRHQLGPDGRETNVVEKEINFVLGSGAHARSYLHQNPDGQLVEAPVAWYAENGGYWAMNPGYDRRDHGGFQRKIDQECFFCHNAYPEIGYANVGAERELFLRGAVPEGIDCQRCHGPGRAHVESVRSGASAAAVRAAIINPARLAPERKLELCLQCHLESTSRRLPYSLRRYGRSLFSYRPGEPLENYMLHFDRATGMGHDDDFEISSTAYRLMKSACFQKSGATLTCTSCHNPHAEATGDGAVAQYVHACQSCHRNSHEQSENCIECHMPKRRTQDVVHVVMTDHYIQRRPPDRDLLAPLTEVLDSERTAYRGEVVPLYPRPLPASLENELYLAVAQVADGANLTVGIPRLRRAIETSRPSRAEFYFELAKAYSKANQNGAAIPFYEEALRREPRYGVARRHYAEALSQVGRVAFAVKALEAATLRDAATLNALGVAYLSLGRIAPAISALRQAQSLDSEMPEIFVNLGTALSRSGNLTAAIDAFRGALRVSPASAAAHSNLATVLDRQGDWAQAEYHFQKAIWSDPDHAVPHYNYGRALAARKMFASAETELETALKLDPRFAEAAVSLGLVLAQTARAYGAIEQYRRAIAIRPGLTSAHYNLGLALLSQGKGQEAKLHFQAVVESDPGDDSAHFYLGRILLSEGNRALAITHLEQASRSSIQTVRAAALDALRAAREKP